LGIALVAASITAALVWVAPSAVATLVPAYTMSSEMEQIADQIGFTDEGLDLFIDARPQLLDSEEFVPACADPADATVDTDEADDDWSSIGCFDEYVYDHGRIAVFRPTDERLINQTIVTTAHEFLHAAYARLTYDDRQALNALLATRWGEVPADALIQEELASSVGSWKGNRATEQFAYLGTEIAEDFDPALEAYYSRYFTDRDAVVSAYLADQALWDGLGSAIESRFDVLTATDEANATEAAQLKADRAAQDADRAAFVGAQAEFNAQSPEDRDITYVEDEDGGSDERYDTYLARYLVGLNDYDTELANRQAQLEAAEAAADLAWEELEPLYDEFDALAAASVPMLD
jgi:hypothetical protein